MRGQAVVEAGLLLPLLVLLLLGIGLIGLAIVERQHVLVASRFVARETSMRALATVPDKFYGKGVVEAATLKSATFDKVGWAKSALGGKRTVEVRTPDWGVLRMARREKLKEVRVGGDYARGLIAQKAVRIGKTSGKMGIGLILYGQVVTSKGPLDAVGKGANEASRMLGGRGGKVWENAGISAQAFMPSELPVRLKGPQGDVGVLDLNPWIKDILEQP